MLSKRFNMPTKKAVGIIISFTIPLMTGFPVSAIPLASQKHPLRSEAALPDLIKPSEQKKLATPLLISQSSTTGATSQFTTDSANHIITINNQSGNITNNLVKAIDFLTKRPDQSTRWTLRLPAGQFPLDQQVSAIGLQNVNFVSDPNNPTVLSKSSKFSSSQGEYLLYIRNCQNINFSGFKLYGQTNFQQNANPVWPDQGLYFGSCNGVTVENNEFYNFGNAALRVSTHHADPSPNVNSFNTTIRNNKFDNIYQISTTATDTTHGGTANLTLQNNRFTNLRGSVKLATRTEGGRNLKLIDNTITNSSHYGFEINSYDDVQIIGNRLENIQGYAMNIYTNPDTPNAFSWGDNYTIQNNVITNAGRGIRFSPNPYKNGYKPVPKNLVITGNTFNGIKVTDPNIPVISIANGQVENARITANKFLNVANKNYVSVTPASTGISVAGNFAENQPFGEPLTATPAPTTPTAPLQQIPATSSASFPPATPTPVTASGEGQTVRISWPDVGNETGYEIWISPDAKTYQFLSSGPENSTSYSHTINSPTSSTYYYKVRAKNALGFSAFSKEAQASITPSAVASSPVKVAPDPNSKPEAPTEVTASATGKTIHIHWQDAAANETAQEVWISTDAKTYQPLARLGANVNTYSHTVSGAGNYYYKIRASNANGFSAFSREAQAQVTP